MSREHLEQLEYERGWVTCERCGCKRPPRELGKELAGATQVFVCLDAAWCERVSTDRVRREALEHQGRACEAVPGCPEPAEEEAKTCARHRELALPLDGAELLRVVRAEAARTSVSPPPPAPAAREPDDPRQQTLPFDE